MSDVGTLASWCGLASDEASEVRKSCEVTIVFMFGAVVRSEGLCV